jgi:hypothetical protein
VAQVQVEMDMLLQVVHRLEHFLALPEVAPAVLDLISKALFMVAEVAEVVELSHNQPHE